MELRHRVALAIAAAGPLAAAPAASAEPSRTGDLGGAAPYAWEGGAVTGLPVVAITDDDTLLHVTQDGKLTVGLADADASAVDLDVLVYRSNAAGDAVGEPIVTGEEPGSQERVAKDVVTGFYLVRVTGWASLQGSYRGRATLAVPAPAPAPLPGATPPTPTAPTAAPDLQPEAKLGRLPRARASRTLVFRGTATDDRGVSRVELAIVRRSGGKCWQLTPRGRFAPLSKCAAPSSFLKARGTSSWSLSVRRLPRGSYTVFARAVDTVGQKQGGFSPSNKKAFKVS